MRIFWVVNELNLKLGADTILNFPKTDSVAVLSLLKGGPQEKILSRAGVKIIKLDFLSFFDARPWKHLRRAKSLLFILASPWIITRVSREIKKFNAQVVHTNLWLSDIIGITAAQRAGIKNIISTQHDNVPIAPLPTLLKRHLLKKVKLVIAISEAVKDFTKAYFFVPDEKIRIIYNGINLDYFEKCQKAEKDWDGSIGVFARLEKIKGHIFLLEAMREMALHTTAPKIYIVGSGSQEKFLKNFSEANNLNVEFIPLTPNIAPILGKVDIVVIPSLSEGFGVVVIEALAAKKLVIASNVGGIKELIFSKKTGILFNPGDYTDLKEKLVEALNTKEASLEISSKGRLWLMKNKYLFDIKNTANEYRNLYSL